MGDGSSNHWHFERELPLFSCGARAFLILQESKSPVSALCAGNSKEKLLAQLRELNARREKPRNVSRVIRDACAIDREALGARDEEQRGLKE